MLIDQLARVPAGIAADPALIKPLSTAPPVVIDATPANRVWKMLWGDRSLFLLDGAPHRRVRKLMLPRMRGEACRSGNHPARFAHGSGIGPGRDQLHAAFGRRDAIVAAVPACVAHVQLLGVRRDRPPSKAFQCSHADQIIGPSTDSG